MDPIDPRKSGGHQGDMNRAKIAPHYTGVEQSSNGGPPKERSTGWRVTPLRVAIGVVVAVAALVVFGLAKGDSSDEQISASLSASDLAEEPAAGGTEELEGGTVERLAVVDGKLVDGPRILTYRKGDVIRLWVDSDRDDVITIEGYDVSQSVEAGGRATFEMRADTEGLYEIALESTGAQVALLRVN